MSHFTEPIWMSEYIYRVNSSDINHIKEWEKRMFIVRGWIKIPLLWKSRSIWWLKLEAYLEPSQTYAMEVFHEIVNGFKPLIIFA